MHSAIEQYPYFNFVVIHQSSLLCHMIGAENIINKGARLCVSISMRSFCVGNRAYLWINTDTKFWKKHNLYLDTIRVFCDQTNIVLQYFICYKFQGIRQSIPDIVSSKGKAKGDKVYFQCKMCRLEIFYPGLRNIVSPRSFYFKYFCSCIY